MSEQSQYLKAATVDLTRLSRAELWFLCVELGVDVEESAKDSYIIQAINSYETELEDDFEIARNNTERWAKKQQRKRAEETERQKQEAELQEQKKVLKEAMQKLAAELEQVKPEAENRRLCKGIKWETEWNPFGIANWGNIEMWSHCGVSAQVAANSAKLAYEECGAAVGLECSTENQAEAEDDEQCVSDESTEPDKQAVKDYFLESELPNSRAEESPSVSCVELTPCCEEASLNLDGPDLGAVEGPPVSCVELTWCCEKAI